MRQVQDSRSGISMTALPEQNLRDDTYYCCNQARRLVRFVGGIGVFYVSPAAFEGVIAVSVLIFSIDTTRMYAENDIVSSYSYRQSCSIRLKDSQVIIERLSFRRLFRSVEGAECHHLTLPSTLRRLSYTLNRAHRPIGDADPTTAVTLYVEFRSALRLQLPTGFAPFSSANAQRVLRDDCRELQGQGLMRLCRSDGGTDCEARAGRCRCNWNRTLI